MTDASRIEPSLVPCVATCDEQLDAWIDGRSTHWGTPSNYQCCPDFSCCAPKLLMPVEARRAFKAADQAGRERFCVASLVGLVAESAAKVHVISSGGPKDPS